MLFVLVDGIVVERVVVDGVVIGRCCDVICC